MFGLAKEKCLLYILYTIYKEPWGLSALPTKFGGNIRYIEAAGSLKEVGIIV